MCIQQIVDLTVQRDELLRWSNAEERDQASAGRSESATAIDTCGAGDPDSGIR